MTNLYSFQVICSNPDAVKAFVLATKDIDREYCQWEEGDTDIYASEVEYLPHQDIIEISRHFPCDVIVCRYNYLSNGYSEDHIIEYRNGVEKEVGIEPCYWFDSVDLEEKDRLGIYDKAKALFLRLDRTETDKEGNIFINWFDYDIVYTFEYACADGKKYEVQTTKHRTMIGLKISLIVSDQIQLAERLMTKSKLTLPTSPFNRNSKLFLVT